MTKHTMTQQEAFTLATREGFKVWHDDDPDARGWWITTPKRFRRAPEDHGTFKTEERAWFAAASMCEEVND